MNSGLWLCGARAAALLVATVGVASAADLAVRQESRSARNAALDAAALVPRARTVVAAPVVIPAPVVVVAEPVLVPTCVFERRQVWNGYMYVTSDSQVCP